MAYPSIPKCYDPERAAATLPVGASRLQVVGHSLAAVASLPRRLIYPPPKHSKDLELRDVLADRHCSPLSLVDLEHYLTYTEHSVENLYFMLWLQAYTAEYATLEHSNSSMAERLTSSATSANQTYIEPGAPYEINLRDNNRSNIIEFPTSPPPPPGIYDAACKEVQWLLDDSLQRWRKNAESNAGWRRLAFSTYVGLANACVTVVAIIIARIYMHGSSGRILAACLTPWLWFAIVGVVCGLKGVCLLCFTAGGNVRQVSSFELSLPRASPTIHSISTPAPMASVTSLGSPISPVSPHYKATLGGNDKTEYPNDPFSPHSARGSEFIIKPTANLRRSRSDVPKAQLVKFWAPMVKVDDPFIIRAYWEVVIAGFLWSLLLAVSIGVIAAAV